MYTPKLYREEDRVTILEFLRKNDFATVIAYDGRKPVGAHLLVEVIEQGDDLVVNGHMSRANPLWKLFAEDREILVIFLGAHTYISPTWYDHVNVPTWNYQSVHVYGRPRIVTDDDERLRLLSSLVSRYEGEGPYRMDSLPQDFVAKEMRGVVAFSVEVTGIEANYKLSQNRDDENHRSIVSHLDQRSDEYSHAVAEAMRRNRPLE